MKTPSAQEIGHFKETAHSLVPRLGKSSESSARRPLVNRPLCSEEENAAVGGDDRNRPKLPWESVLLDDAGRQAELEKRQLERTLVSHDSHRHPVAHLH